MHFPLHRASVVLFDRRVSFFGTCYVGLGVPVPGISLQTIMARRCSGVRHCRKGQPRAVHSCSLYCREFALFMPLFRIVSLPLTKVNDETFRRYCKNDKYLGALPIRITLRNARLGQCTLGVLWINDSEVSVQKRSSNGSKPLWHLTEEWPKPGVLSNPMRSEPEFPAI